MQCVLHRPGSATRPPLASSWQCMRRLRPAAADHARLPRPAAAPGKDDGASSTPLTPDLAAIAAEALAADPVASARLARVQDAAARVAALQEEQARLAAALEQASAEGGGPAVSPALAAAQAAVKAREAELEVATAAAAVGRAQAAAAAAEVEARAAAAAASVEADRLESAKAGAAGAAGSAIAALPYALAMPTSGASGLSGVLGVLAAAAFGGLMGVTYRYAVRTDADNRQLALGAAAAFGLARGIGGAEALQSASVRAGGSPLDLGSVVGPAALGAGQAVLGAAFAAAAVEAAFRAGWVSRMGNDGRPSP